jgi:choline-sulfatase
MHFRGPDQRHGYQQRLVGDITETTWGGRTPAKTLYKRYGGDDRVLLEAAPGDSRVLAYDRAVVDAACERLAEHDPSEPLFLTVGLYGPHSPYCCEPGRFAFYYDALPRLPVGPQPADTHPAIRDHLALHEMLAPDAEAFHRARAAYWGMVQTLDDHVGRVRAAAAEALGDDVLFVYASDHGDLAGAHGMFWKCMMYDGSAKVPLIAAGADLPAGRRIEAPTGLVDLGVTLLSACGTEPMPQTDGVDLWAALRGESDAPGRPIISQHANRHVAQPPVGMVRQGRWKLIAYGGYPRPQLFDMEADPAEVNDLAAEPDAATHALIFELSQTLYAQWDPDAANRTAKLATRHMRRLHPFHRDLDEAMPELWWPPDEWSERRDDFPAPADA